jgi:hypothetical protein
MAFLVSLGKPTPLAAQAFQEKDWNQIDVDRISDQAFTETSATIGDLR